jgi:hypothetical protein
MPGFAFHHETLKAANPVAANSPAANFGAMGPDIFRFLPPSLQLTQALTGGSLSGTDFTTLQNVLVGATPFNSLGASQQATIQQSIPLLLELWAKPLGTVYSLILGDNGLNVAVNWPTISKLESLIATLTPIVNAQNQWELVGQISNVLSISSDVTQLKQALANMQALSTNLLFMPMLGPWMELPPTLAPTLTSIVPNLKLPKSQADQAGCRLYEFLRWHRSGRFANALLKNAGNATQKQFAEGWLCHLATSVTAEPFINSIAGGPYRTHWWRNMLVQNFVDSWAFGFAQQAPAPTMAGNTPTPPYTAWPALTSSDLQKVFDIGNSLSVPAPGVPPAAIIMGAGSVMSAGGVPITDPGQLISSLPAATQTALNDIADLFTVALKSTYPGPASDFARIGASGLPMVGATFAAPDTLQAAYMGAFAVYWFLTSSSGPFGTNIPPPLPSPSCGTMPPSWMTTPGSTPTPGQAGLNVPGAICAVLLAILALLETLAGDLVAGLAALAAAMSTSVVDWSTVACNLSWANFVLVNSEVLLAQMLVMAGLAYPAPDGLFTSLFGNIQPAPDASGIPLTQTQPRPANPLYPAGLDQTVSPFPGVPGEADMDFQRYPFSPGVPTETPATDLVIQNGIYPSAVFTAAPPTVLNGGVMGAGGTFPTLGESLGTAVANAQQVLANAAQNQIPNYNLDGDRGYGWLGWHPAPASVPFNPPIVAQPDH